MGPEEYERLVAEATPATAEGLEELKAKHPEVYWQIIRALAAVKQESDDNGGAIVSRDVPMDRRTATAVKRILFAPIRRMTAPNQAAWLGHLVRTAIRPRERRDASSRSSAKSGDSPDSDEGEPSPPRGWRR